MKKKKFGIRTVAALAAVFMAALAFPLTASLAAGSSIVITIDTVDHDEGAGENWQNVADFTIDSAHLPITSAQLTVVAHDVDAPVETDRIRIYNASNEYVDLGRLTGMNGEDNTTVFDVSAAFLAEGTYEIKVDMGSTVNGVLEYDGGWRVQIKSAVLVLNGGNSTMSADTSFEASGQTVNTTIDFSGLVEGDNYNVEYKFSDLTAEKQIASATDTYTATGTTGQLLKTLTLEQSDAIVDGHEYHLDIIVTHGSEIMTAGSALGGEQTVTPTVDPNTYYKIDITTGEGGSTDPVAPAYAIENESSPTIHFIPDQGFTVGNVKIDGVSIGAVQSYTFEDVTTGHTVEVEFVPLATPPQTGSVSLIGFAVLAILCSAGCFVLARKRS